MKEKIVAIGNVLIGDVFTTWPLFKREEGVRNVAFCVRYNEDAVRALNALVPSVHMDEIRVEQTTTNDQLGLYIDLYFKWCTHFLGMIPHERVWVLGEGKGLPSWDVFPDTVTPRTFEPIVTCQLSSARFGKNWDLIADAIETHSALSNMRKVTLCDHALTRGVGELWNMCPLEEVGRLMLRSRVHVGIASSMSNLAWQLGIPTVICVSEDMKGWDIPTGLKKAKDFPHIRLLQQPTVIEIQTAISDLLSCDVPIVTSTTNNV